MKFTGKSHLQEIYDNGSEKLSELETAAFDKLKSLRNLPTSSKQDREDAEGASFARIEDKHCELEAELKTLMQKSVEHLEKVIEGEVNETNKHLTFLVNELSNLADKLKSSIVEMRKSHEDNLFDFTNKISNQYECAVEQAKIDMEREDYVSSKQLKAHSTFAMNSMQQKLDHILWQSRSEEKQVNSALFKMFMQKAHSVDTHFSGLMQKLSHDFQKQFKRIESMLETSESELESELHALFSQVDEQTTQAEHELKDIFTTTYEAHIEDLKMKSAKVTDELSNLHDFTTEKITQQTRGLSSDLLTASNNAGEALSVRCKDLNRQIDQLAESFTQSLENKVKACLSFKHNLEEENNSIVEHIRKELLDTKDAFESRVTELISSATNGLNTIMNDAESEIQFANRRCEDQLKSQAANVKNDIEKSVGNFLTQVKEHQRAALEEIDKATYSLSDTKRVSHTQSKRSKKNENAAARSAAEEKATIVAGADLMSSRAEHSVDTAEEARKKGAESSEQAWRGAMRSERGEGAEVPTEEGTGALTTGAIIKKNEKTGKRSAARSGGNSQAVAGADSNESNAKHNEQSTEKTARKGKDEEAREPGSDETSWTPEHIQSGGGDSTKH